MLDEITMLEFREWMAYAELEPFDEWRQDMRNAHIVQTIRNLFRKHPISLEDCVLPFESRPKKRKTPKEMFAIAKMWAGMPEN